MVRTSKVGFKRCVHSCLKSKRVQSGYQQQYSSTAPTPLPREQFLCNPTIKKYKTDIQIQHFLVVNNKGILCLHMILLFTKPKINVHTHDIDALVHFYIKDLIFEEYSILQYVKYLQCYF